MRPGFRDARHFATASSGASGREGLLALCAYPPARPPPRPRQAPRPRPLRAGNPGRPAARSCLRDQPRQCLLIASLGPSNSVWVNTLTFRACCKVHKDAVWRGNKLQHPSRSHPPPAPALPAAVSQGRGEGYCELRSSTCFIHGSLHSARIFLPESFKKNLNTNYLVGEKKTNHQETLQPSTADIGSLQHCGFALRQHIPRSKPAVSGLLFP